MSTKTKSSTVDNVRALMNANAPTDDVRLAIGAAADELSGAELFLLMSELADYKPKPLAKLEILDHEEAHRVRSLPDVRGMRVFPPRRNSTQQYAYLDIPNVGQFLYTLDLIGGIVSAGQRCDEAAEQCVTAFAQKGASK